MTQRQEAHEYLRRQFAFPEYYGANLDALYDCLCELNDVQIRILHADEGIDYFPRLYRVLMDAAAENDTLSLTVVGEAEDTE
jgi:RNAse (barnase) inhibitor barstar